MGPTLLVLAAGMGSRYGGLKQLDPMGPNGETLLDFSVYDALRAGFGSVTFVIRRDIEEVFKNQIGNRYAGQTKVRYVFQELSDLPGGHAVPEGRQKPWGTGHAIWCARNTVMEPFAAINADDFYGSEAYATLGTYLRSVSLDAKPSPFAMVGYQLRKTLSDHGTVSRGVCRVNAQGMLEGVREYTRIERSGPGGRNVDEEGATTEFSGDEPVSMNFWGFTPAIFPMLEASLLSFLANQGGDLKAEFQIPATVADLIASGEATLKVLESQSIWFGVTYREDKPLVQEAVQKLVTAGTYPSPLWGV